MIEHYCPEEFSRYLHCGAQNCNKDLGLSPKKIINQLVATDALFTLCLTKKSIESIMIKLRFYEYQRYRLYGLQKSNSKNTKACKHNVFRLFVCVPGMGDASRVQVPNIPLQLEMLAKCKGVHREVESEGKVLYLIKSQAGSEEYDVTVEVFKGRFGEVGCID